MTHLTARDFITLLEPFDGETAIRFSMNGAYLDAPEFFFGRREISLSFGARSNSQPRSEQAVANAYDLIGRLRESDERLTAAWSQSNAESLLAWWEPRLAAAQVARDDLLAVVTIAPSRDEPAPYTTFPRSLTALDYFCGELQEIAVLVSRMMHGDSRHEGRKRLAMTVGELISKLHGFDRDAGVVFSMGGANLEPPAVRPDVHGISIHFRDRAEPTLTPRAAIANARDAIGTIRKGTGAFLAREEQFAGMRDSERFQTAIERFCEDECRWWDGHVASAERALADLLTLLPFETPKKLMALDDHPVARTQSFSELCIELERLIILVERAI
jgi:hypothetical protein